jgi:hypothetical protein
MKTFTKVSLVTGPDGRAEFREELIPLSEGSPQARFSEVFPASGVQMRESPVGFHSQVHVTGQPQWVFILGGVMEIGLADCSSRLFTAGEHFYSADTLPEGSSFDPKVHGHWSRQVGDQPLVTLFVKT